MILLSSTEAVCYPQGIDGPRVLVTRPSPWVLAEGVVAS